MIDTVHHVQVVSLCVFACVIALQGGAVSGSCEHGQVDVKDSRFSLNTGLSAGGAVSVTERKVVVITITTFTAMSWCCLGSPLAVPSIASSAPK